MAESGFDGDIKLRVSLDTNALKEDLQKLKQEIDKTINSSSFSGMNEAVQKIEEAFTNLSNKIDEVGQHLEKVSATSISSDEVQKFHDELNNIVEAVKNATSQTQELGETAAQSSEGFDKTAQSINQASQCVDDISNRLNDVDEVTNKFNGTLGDTVNEAHSLRNSIEDAFNSDAFDSMDAKTQRARMNLEQLYNKSQELEQKLQELASQKAPTEEYAELKQAMEDDLATQQKINEQILKMEDSPAFDATSEKYQNLQRQANDLVIDIQMLRTEMEMLEEDGEAFTDAFANPEGVERLQQQLDAVNDKIRIAELSLNRTSEATDKTAEAMKKWESFGKQVEKILSDILTDTFKIVKVFGTTLVTAAKKFYSIIVKISTTIKNMFFGAAGSAAKGVLSFGQLVKAILLAGIGVQGLTSLFRKLRSEIVSGMQAAINSVESVKTAFESIKTSVSTLKAQLSMAFLPLVEVAIPYIQQLCAWFANLISLVSQFIAALTGASTWRKVTKVIPKSSGGGGSKKSQEEKNAEKQAKVDKQNEKKQAAYDKKVAAAYKKADEQEAKVNERNAKALERYEKAQRKAADADKKRLSGLDILNNMTTQETEIEEPELEEFDKEAYLADLLDGIGELELAVADLDDAIGGAGTDLYEYVEEPISDKIKNLVDWIKDMWAKGDFTELGEFLGRTVRDWLEKIPWDKIQTQAEKLGKSVATLLNGWLHTERLAYDLGKTGAEAINTMFHFLNRFIKELEWDSLGKYIADKMNGLFDNIDWQLIYDTFVTGAQKLLLALQTWIDNFHWDNIFKTISAIGVTLGDALKNLFDPRTFGQLGRKLGEQVKKLLNNKVLWKSIANGIKNLVKSAIAFVSEFLGQVSITDVLNALETLVGTLFEDVDFSKAGRDLAQKINDLFSDEELMNRITDDLAKVVNAILGFIANLIRTLDIEKIKNAIKEFLGKLNWNDIMTVLGAALKAALWIAAAKLIKLLTGTLLSAVFGALWKWIGAKLIAGFGVLKTLIGSALTKLGAWIIADIQKGIFLPKLISWFTKIGGTLKTIMTSTWMSKLLAGAGTVAAGLLAFFEGAEIGKKIGALIFPDDADLYEYYSGFEGTIQMMKDTAIAFKDWMDMTFGNGGSMFTDNESIALNAKNVVLKNIIRENYDEITNLTDAYMNHKMVLRDGQTEADAFNDQMLHLIYNSDTYADAVARGNGNLDTLIATMNDEELANFLVDTIQNTKEFKTETDTAVEGVNELGDAAAIKHELLQEQIELSSQKVKDFGTGSEEALSGGLMRGMDRVVQGSDDVDTKLEEMGLTMEQVEQLASDTGVSTEEMINILTGGFDDVDASLDETAQKFEDLGASVEISEKLVDRVVTELKTQIDTQDWNAIWQPVGDGFDTFWTEFAEKVKTQVTELLTEIPSMVETNLNMQTILEPINTQVSEFMNTVKTTVSTKMGEITTAVSDGITNMKVTIGSSLTGINDSFSNAFNGIGQMVGNLMRNITQTISQGMSITAKAYNDGWAAMLRSTQTAVQQMLNMISRLISQLNQVPRALENTMRQMERVSQQTSKLNVGSMIGKAKNFKIGGAASGAVIPPSMAEHLVKVGDNNRETEIISPLSTMKQAMSEVLANMNMSGGSGDIVVQIDGREVFRAMRSENSNYMKQNGGRSAFV